VNPSPLALGTFLAAAAAACGADYSTVNSKLASVIREEMREWDIRGIAVALVDDQHVIHAAGFGEAHRDSIFRVGSISKLFNAIAVLQQVEAGKLDLDAPLPAAVLPLNPFPGAPAVTLRHILCHRSGLQRESPIGGYFDDTEAGIAATVASIRPCVLVTPPGAATRYSNLAPTIAGHLVERASGQSFEAYQQTRILGPLALAGAAWTRSRLPPGRLIPSHLRVADGRGGWIRRPAPEFDLGTIPAGNLYASAEQLARLASALIANDGKLVRPSTLAEMWRPQLTAEATGFGLGFRIGKFRERRSVGHSGAVYGHSTSLVILPEEKIAVVVLANEDIVNGRVQRIVNSALGLMLEAKFGDTPPAVAAPVPPDDLSALAGDYESESHWARVELRAGKLTADIAGQATRLSPLGPLRFAADSRITHAATVVFTHDSSGKVAGFTMGDQHFFRTPAAPAPLPPEWRRFLGSYGPDFIPVVVSERHGHLYAMTENMVDYRLTPLNRTVCALPPGMYVNEHVVFLTGPDGAPRALDFANMILPRRP
jgi:CubicO group peptidase (beta-lactamase class C family)